jgi:hypothetical protein
MITLGGFIWGIIVAVIGFLMVWKTHKFREHVGSLNMLFGYPQHSWLDWNLLGVIMVIVGIFMMFGLMQEIILLLAKGFFPTP